MAVTVASSDFKLCVDDDNEELDTVSLIFYLFRHSLFHLCEC